MKTLRSQHWEIYFRNPENIDELADNIMFTVYALFLFAPGLILAIIDPFHGKTLVMGLGILTLVYSLSRFIAGLISGDKATPVGPHGPRGTE